MICLRVAEDGNGKGELFIDYQSDNVAFTVVDGDRQYDFNLELKEWEWLKDFVDKQIEDE